MLSSLANGRHGGRAEDTQPTPQEKWFSISSVSTNAEYRLSVSPLTLLLTILHSPREGRTLAPAVWAFPVDDVFSADIKSHSPIGEACFPRLLNFHIALTRRCVTKSKGSYFTHHSYPLSNSNAGASMGRGRGASVGAASSALPLPNIVLIF